MADFIAKPPTPVPWARHPTLAGVQLWAPICSAALPPRDAISNTAGVLANLGTQSNAPSMTSGPFGPAIQFDATSQQIQWPGRGYVGTLPGQVTLFAVYRGDSYGTSPRLFSTCGLSNGCLELLIQSTNGPGAFFASGAATYAGFGASVAGRWYGLVASVDIAGARVSFWLCDYTAGSFQSATNLALTIGTTANCSGPPALNPDASHAFQGAISDFGFATALWTDRQARDYLRDPAAPFRRRGASPLASAYAVAPPIARSVADDGPSFGFIEA